jgi:hypothetical protein
MMSAAQVVQDGIMAKAVVLIVLEIALKDAILEL